MILNVKYFGLIAELTTREEEVLEFSGSTIFDFLEVLNAKYPELMNTNFQVAQEREIVSKETQISGKEIALLPPFSGG